MAQIPNDSIVADFRHFIEYLEENGVELVVSPFAETLMNRLENPLFFGVPGITDGYVEMPEGITGLGYELNTNFSEYKLI